AVDALEGVSSSDVEIGKVGVQFDEAKVSQADIEAAIVNAGYKVVS
ncbi:MAG: copper chaperone, partial [Desulfobacterales bacterium]|nr:copper chaperone [Desulfobacterales bacterium]